MRESNELNRYTSTEKARERTGRLADIVIKGGEAQVLMTSVSRSLLWFANGDVSKFQFFPKLLVLLFVLYNHCASHLLSLVDHITFQCGSNGICARTQR